MKKIVFLLLYINILIQLLIRESVGDGFSNQSKQKKYKKIFEFK